MLLNTLVFAAVIGQWSYSQAEARPAIKRPAAKLVVPFAAHETASARFAALETPKATPTQSPTKTASRSRVDCQCDPCECKPPAAERIPVAEPGPAPVARARPKPPKPAWYVQPEDPNFEIFGVRVGNRIEFTEIRRRPNKSYELNYPTLGEMRYQRHNPVMLPSYYPMAGGGGSCAGGSCSGGFR